MYLFLYKYDYRNIISIEWAIFERNTILINLARLLNVKITSLS